MFFPRLIMQRLMIEGFARLKRGMLQEAAAEWEVAQIVKEAFDPPRSYRATTAFAEGVPPSLAFLRDTTELLCAGTWEAVTNALPADIRRDEHAAVATRAFQMLSRAGACAQHWVALPERGYPHKLLAVLTNPDLANRVVDDAQCRPFALDSLSGDIVHEYGTMERPRSTEAMQQIRCLARSWNWTQCTLSACSERTVGASCWECRHIGRKFH